MDLNSETQAPMGIDICEDTGTNLPQVLKGSSTNSWIISGLLRPVDPRSPFNFSFDKLFGISVCHSLHLNRECGEPMELP